LLLPAVVRAPHVRHGGVPVVLRVDTGAAIALLDLAVLTRLRLAPVGSTAIQGVLGPGQRVPLYRVSLDLGPRGYLPAMAVAGLTLPPSADADGLFGANLLRHGILQYNGPAGVWSFRVTQP